MLDAALRPLFNQTVTTKSLSTHSFYGAPSYSASASSWEARIEERTHVVKGPGGEDVVARGTVFVIPTTGGTEPDIGTQDQMTLPDGTTPDILSVERLYDDSTSLYYQAVHFG